MSDHVPILWNHDPNKPIGYAEIHNGKLICRLVEPMTREQVFKTFGNMRMIVLEQLYPKDGGEGMINAIEIMEWSLIT